MARKRAPDFDLLALLRGALAPGGTLKLGPLRNEDKCSGEGSEHLTYTESAPWLDNIDPVAEPWVDAIAAMDQRGDREPLLELLRPVVPPDAYPHVADMLVRYQRRQRPRPSYDLPPKEAQLYVARNFARDLVRDGASVQSALATAANAFGLPPERVAVAYGGKRGSMQRAMRKLRATRPRTAQ